MARYLEREARLDGLDVGTRLAHVPVIDEAIAQQTAPASYDFCLHVGGGAPASWLLRLTQHGVWTFSHEANVRRHPFLRETRRGEPVVHVALCASKVCDRTTVPLEAGAFRVDPRSYAATKAHVHGCVAEWPARAARRLATTADPRGAYRIPEGAPSEEQEDDEDRLLPFLARLACQRITFAWNRLFNHAQWNIGVLRTPVHMLLHPGAYDDGAITWFPLSARGRFLADPFGVERNGVLHIMCEDYDSRTQKGVIAALRYSDGRYMSDPVTVLDLPVHLSYPCLVEEDGTLYAVPESSESNEIALYRIDELDRPWTKVAVMLDGFAGVDPTVFRHDGRWWLACTPRGRDAETTLWLWHATSLRGPWTPHTANPVKTDVRSTRPGGPTFVHEGALYRPTQDCSRSYGGRLAIQRVRVLTPDEFAEETVAIIAPDAHSPFPLGRHTLSAVGDLVLIDGHRVRFDPQALMNLLRRIGYDLGRRLRRQAPLT
jgi:hypothetical protein